MKYLILFTLILFQKTNFAQNSNYKLVKVYDKNGKILSTDTIIINNEEKWKSVFNDLKISEKIQKELSKDSIQKWDKKIDIIWNNEIKPTLSKATEKLKEAEVDKKIEQIRKDKIWDEMKQILEQQQQSWDKFYKENHKKLDQWIDDFRNVFEEK